MLRKTPVLTRVTKTSARDVEAAHFRCDSRTDEYSDQRGQDRQPPAVKKLEDDCQTANDFQPRQIKREPHADEPRQRFVIVNHVRELDRVECLQSSGVNKNTTDEHIEYSPEDFHRFSTAQLLNLSTILLHPLFPAPLQMKMSFSRASSPKRFATSR